MCAARSAAEAASAASAASAAAAAAAADAASADVAAGAAALLRRSGEQAALASHEELVAAPYALVWRMLEKKVYEPQLSVPGIENVRILRDGGNGKDGVERKMFQKLRGNDIHELITWTNDDSRCLVTFAMLSDPQLEGVVTNEAEAVDATTTRVKYEMDWKYRPDVPVESRKVPFPAEGGGAAGVIKGAVRCPFPARAAAGGAPPRRVPRGTQVAELPPRAQVLGIKAAAEKAFAASQAPTGASV